MDNVFDKMLEKDEHIIKVFKPNKKRYYKKLWILAIPFLWPIIIIASVLTLFIGTFLFFKYFNRSYEKAYFAYTNKRVMSLSGIINEHFFSLEYNNLSAPYVTVGVFDKKLNTGTILFQNVSAHHIPVVFENIENPYEILKDIKELMTKN